MKKPAILLSVLSSLLISCNTTQQQKSTVVEIDVTQSYPQKEIRLSEIASIKYVQLDDSNEEYLFNGYQLTFTENNIVVFNQPTGDILFFDHQGKPKSKFNHKGSGPNEYQMVSHAVYMEQTDELYTLFRNKIQVYSSTGEYKRTLTLPAKAWITEIIGIDNNTLLVYDNSRKYSLALGQLNSMSGVDTPQNSPKKEDILPAAYACISTEDGRVMNTIDIPEDPTVSLSVAFEQGEIKGVTPGKCNRIVRYNKGLLLRNQETDTAYFYNLQTMETTPAYIQLPSVKSLSPMVYVNNLVQADKYDFIEIYTLRIAQPGKLESKYLVRDRESDTTYETKIVFDEIKGKTGEISPSMTAKSAIPGMGIITLGYNELQEAKGDNRLSGELKQMVDSMGTNENDVYMLLFFNK